MSSGYGNECYMRLHFLSYIIIIINNLVMCEQPPSPVNGSIVYVNGTLEHSQAVYQCNHGLFPPGLHITDCVRDDTTGAGKWSPNPMNVMCRPYPCKSYCVQF